MVDYLVQYYLFLKGDSLSFSPKFEFLSQISAGFSNVTEVSEDVKRNDITY